MNFFFGEHREDNLTTMWNQIFLKKVQGETRCPYRVSWTFLQSSMREQGLNLDDHIFEKFSELTNLGGLVTDERLFALIREYLIDQNEYLIPQIHGYPDIENPRIEIPISIPKEHIKLYNQWYREALELIKLCTPSLYDLYQKLVLGVIPIIYYKSNKLHKRGLTTLNLPRFIFTTFGDRNYEVASVDLAIDLVHELGHIMLNAYIYSDELLYDQHAPIYSSVRNVERPAFQSFHALAALCNMIEFTGQAKNTTHLNAAQMEFASHKFNTMVKQYIEGLGIFNDKAILTRLGQKIISEMNHSRDLFYRL